MNKREILLKAKEIGINIPIKYFDGEGEYHYFDQINHCIMLDSTIEEITLVDIVHEFTHYLQWTEGYKDTMISELDKEYDARSFEYHAEIVGLNWSTFLLEGKLNTKEILSYYDDILEIFNKGEIAC